MALVVTQASVVCRGILVLAVIQRNSRVIRGSQGSPVTADSADSVDTQDFAGCQVTLVFAGFPGILAFVASAVIQDFVGYPVIRDSAVYQVIAGSVDFLGTVLSVGSVELAVGLISLLSPMILPLPILPPRKLQGF